MRTITRSYDLYPVYELDEKSFKNAYLDWYMKHHYPYDDDNRKTLEEFCNMFQVTCYHRQYDSNGYSYRFRTDHTAEVENLSGQRLAVYLHNNYWNLLFRPVTYWSRDCKKERRSRIFRNNSCVLTGYWIDEDILGPVYEFLRRPVAGLTFHSLIDLCLANFFKTCSKDVECTQSKDYFREESESNAWEYLADGTLFKPRTDEMQIAV